MEDFHLPLAARRIHATLPEDVRAHIDSINAGETPGGRGHYVVDRLHEEGLAHSHRALQGLIEQQPGFLVRHPQTGKLGWHVGPPRRGTNPGHSAVAYGPGDRRAQVERRVAEDDDNGGAIIPGLHRVTFWDHPYFGPTPELRRAVISESAALHGHEETQDMLSADHARALTHHYLWHGFHDDHPERLAKMEEIHQTLARTDAALVRLAKLPRDSSLSVNGPEATRRALGQVGNVLPRPVARVIGKGKSKGVVPIARLIDPAAATAYRAPPKKKPYVLPEALATAGTPPDTRAEARPNADLDEAFADPAPTPKVKAHPWLEGTRVGHHLQELAAHSHTQIAEAARAVLTQTDPKAAARLGKLLAKLHELGGGDARTRDLEGAYNWGTMQRNLDGDRLLHAHLVHQAAQTGKTVEELARSMERGGDGHPDLEMATRIHGTHRSEARRAISRIVDRYADKRETDESRKNADLDDAFGLGDGSEYTTPERYLSWLSNDEHARLSKLGTLAHGLAAGVAAAVGHGIGGMTGMENAEYPGAALGLYAGLGRLGTLARGGVDALMAHIAKRRAARGGKLSPRIEALIAQVQEKKPPPDHGPTPARSRVSFVRALREAKLDPRLSHDADLLRVWHLNAGHLGIDGEGALNAAARQAGIGHLRAHGYLPLPPDRPVSTTPARINASAPPGKPQVEYKRYASAPRVTPGDLFAGFDAGPPPAAKVKPSATRKKKVKRPPGPNLFDQV